MTTPKKIKREIRERMKATKETYMAARKHVLAEKGIDPKTFVAPDGGGA